MGVLACIVVFFACACVYDRWKDIGTIAHNKSAITVEITSRDDTINFHMVSVVSAGSPRSAHSNTKHFPQGGTLQLQIPQRRKTSEAASGFNHQCFFLTGCVSAGGYGNGQVHRSTFHGQTQILQTEQNLHRVSVKVASKDHLKVTRALTAQCVVCRTELEG